MIQIHGVTNKLTNLPLWKLRNVQNAETNGIVFVQFDSIEIPTGTNLATIKTLQINVNNNELLKISFPLILKSLLGIQRQYAVNYDDKNKLYHNSITRAPLKLPLYHIVHCMEESNNFYNKSLEGVPVIENSPIDILIVSSSIIEFVVNINIVPPREQFNKNIKCRIINYMTFESSYEKIHKIVPIDDTQDLRFSRILIESGEIESANLKLDSERTYAYWKPSLQYNNLVNMYQSIKCVEIDVSTALWLTNVLPPALWLTNVLPREICDIITTLYENMLTINHLYQFKMDSGFEQPHNLWSIYNHFSHSFKKNDNLEIILKEPSEVRIHIIYLKPINF